MVFDLLLEVEALRTVVSASKLGVGGKDSAYGRAYRQAAYLTHNACGPSSGLEKPCFLFYLRRRPKTKDRVGGGEGPGASAC